MQYNAILCTLETRAGAVMQDIIMISLSGHGCPYHSDRREISLIVERVKSQEMNH